MGDWLAEISIFMPIVVEYESCWCVENELFGAMGFYLR